MDAYGYPTEKAMWYPQCDCNARSYAVLRRALAVGILCAALVAGVGPARASLVVLSPDQTTYAWPFIYTSSGSLVFVYLVAGVSAGSPIEQVKLAIPTPPCLTLVMGPAGIESGTTLDLIGCGSGTQVIATLIYVTNNLDSCCTLLIRPYESVFGFDLEGTDCNGGPVMVDRRGLVVQPPGVLGCGGPTVPSNPWPPDGATDVSPTPALTWESEPTVGTNLGVFEMRLFLGTTSDPPLVEYYAFPPHTVGPLEPSTTYYWKIGSYVSDFGSATGPVWQFTTAATVSVQRSTWGAIKAMYR